MVNVTKREVPVLIEMIENYENEYISSFHNIAINLQMEKRDVRNICRSLKRKGLTKHNVAFSNKDDGMLSGSGYMLTISGYRLAKELIT